MVIKTIFGIAKRGYGMLGKGKKVSSTIKSVKPAKDLTKRRKDQQDLFKVVDDQYKKIGVKPGSGASKIKKDAAKKVSAIYDKYEAIKARGK